MIAEEHCSRRVWIFNGQSHKANELWRRSAEVKQRRKRCGGCRVTVRWKPALQRHLLGFLFLYAVTSVFDICWIHRSKIREIISWPMWKKTHRGLLFQLCLEIKVLRVVMVFVTGPFKIWESAISPSHPSWVSSGLITCLFSGTARAHWALFQPSGQLNTNHGVSRKPLLANFKRGDSMGLANSFSFNL